MRGDGVVAGRDRNSLVAWLRDATLIVVVVGAAWTIGSTIARIDAKMDHAIDLIERNTQAIERNAQGIERVAQGVAQLQVSVASLSGSYEEHLRHHEQLAAP